MTLITELTKAKAIFQQRAVLAALGVTEYPASLCSKSEHISAPIHAQTASMSHAAPVDTQDGGGNNVPFNEKGAGV